MLINKATIRWLKFKNVFVPPGNLLMGAHGSGPWAVLEKQPKCPVF